MVTGSESLSWFQWHFHLEIVVGVFLLEGVYLLGVGPLRRRYRLADAAPSRPDDDETGSARFLKGN